MSTLIIFNLQNYLQKSVFDKIKHLSYQDLKQQQQDKNTNLENQTQKGGKKNDSQKKSNNQKLKKNELYEITPKGWLKNDDKCSKLLFDKGIEREEFLKIHERILGKRSNLNHLKVLEVSEITRKDEEGGELLNLGNDFHHMYLILQLEETIQPEPEKKFKGKHHPKNKNIKDIACQEETKNDDEQQQNNQSQQVKEPKIEKRIVWFRLEYLRESKMQFYYALKFRRIPQDFGKLLRIRRFTSKNGISLQNVLEEVESYQNLKEFDPWEHNCQRFIKTVKSLLDLEEI